MTKPTDTKKTLPVTLTSSALKAVKQILKEQKIPDDHGLRVGVVGGGCSGFSYEIGFDIFQEGDDTFEMEGITVFLQKKHALHLFGIEIDWEEGINNRGFTFNNPNAKSTCGCGTSFSV